MKVCCRCKEPKSLASYSRLARSRDGYSARCKACDRVYSHAPENIQRERARSRSMERLYKELIQSSRRRPGLSFSITFAEFCGLRGLSCHYCDGPLPQAGHGLDRKDNSLGYTVSNVVPCCSNCNGFRRNVYSYDEFVEIAQVLKRIQARRVA